MLGVVQRRESRRGGKTPWTANPRPRFPPAIRRRMAVASAVRAGSRRKSMRKRMNRLGLRLGACAAALTLTGVLACKQQTPRADSAITSEVETQLALQRDLQGSKIEATALNGEVTLSGTVPNE